MRLISLFTSLKWDPHTKAFVSCEPVMDGSDIDALTVYCAEELRKCMDSISPDLRFEMELEQHFPSNGFKLPTLDTSLYVTRPDNAPPVIQYEFYEKPMNSKYVIMEKSAMEHSSKLSILSNDLVRRQEGSDY